MAVNVWWAEDRLTIMKGPFKVILTYEEMIQVRKEMNRLNKSLRD